MEALALQDMNGVMRIVFSLSFRCSSAPRGHDGGDGAAEAEEQGDERPPGKSQAAHDVVHDKGDAGHVAAVLQDGKRQEEDEDVRQEGQDAAQRRK